MQKITTFLTFDNQAEEAVDFYTSIFKNSKVNFKSYYKEGMYGPAGQMMIASFDLEGQTFMALNAGPSFKFEQGFSLYVDCADQTEVDDVWDRLSAGGETQMCGWLKDKFGVSWQIIPSVLGTLMQDPDPEKSGRVMQAMLQMVKIDIATLQRAYDAA